MTTQRPEKSRTRAASFVSIVLYPIHVLLYTDENASFYERVRDFSGRCVVILRTPGLICL
jgi:hypothetical protein